MMTILTRTRSDERSGGLRFPAGELKVARALPLVQACLDELSKWLSDGATLVGEQLSLSDLHTLPMIHYLAVSRPGAELLSARPRLKSWLCTMRQRESSQSLLQADR